MSLSGQILHAGLIALQVDRTWRGILIRGPSGSGKSSLALKAMSAGFRLVADDRVILWQHQHRLFGRAPDALRDLIEIRGIGISRQTTMACCGIDLIIDCLAREVDQERMPDPAFDTLAGCKIPRLALWPQDPCAPEKLFRAIRHLGEWL